MIRLDWPSLRALARDLTAALRPRHEPEPAPHACEADHPMCWPELRALPVADSATYVAELTDWRDAGLDCMGIFLALDEGELP